jgi:catechol 2,3-dioxygenase-like lactoylglutathione lyase family enzyme
MAPAVRSMVAATYVRDIEASRGFYELLGFRQHRTGTAATAAWVTLHHDPHVLLLASTRPPLAIPRLPLLFYFFFDDLDAVVEVLGSAGVEVTRVGYPPHAPGGEARLVDPDGNTVLLGQPERSASQAPPGADQPAHFSLLKEAAALVEAGGGTTACCQVGTADRRSCPRKAEVRLADSAGDTVWACLPHAEEILMTVRGAFIASPGERGIASFVSRRRAG